MSDLASAIPAILDQLVLSCQHRPSLVGVAVNSGPMFGDVRPEHILFLSVRASEDQIASGLDNREEYPTIYGQIWTARLGADQRAITASYTRAYQILAALNGILVDDTDLQALCDYIELTSHNMVQDVGGVEQWRVCIIEFEIAFLAHLT